MNILHLLYIGTVAIKEYVVFCYALLVTIPAVVCVSDAELLVFKSMSMVHKEDSFAAQLQDISYKLQFSYSWWPKNIDNSNRSGNVSLQIFLDFATRIELVNAQLRIFDSVLYEFRR